MAYLPNAISNETVDLIVQDAKSFESLSEQRHFVEKGKDFFKTVSGLTHLQRLVRELKKHTDFTSHMAKPVIQHAYLLYKSTGGHATHMHQDRPYWLDIEEKATMVTAWFFLDDIDSEKGCLRLNPQSQFDLSKGYLFNKESDLLPHINCPAAKGFNKIIPEEMARELESSLKTVSGRKGDVVIFDGFEVHASMPNNTKITRRAMKIVIGDGLKEFYVSMKDIETSIPLKILALNKIQNVKKKLLGQLREQRQHY